MASRPAFIRSIALMGYADFVATCGGDAEALAAEARVPVEALRNTDILIPFHAYAALFEISARRLSMPAFGVQWSAAMSRHFSKMGPMLFLARFARTARDWLEISQRCWPYHSNAYRMAIEHTTAPDHIIFRFVTSPLVYASRQNVEHAIANLSRMVDLVIDRPGDNAQRVCFAFPAPVDPADRAIYTSLFNCPVEFGAEHSEITFRREILDHRINGNLRLLRTVLNLYVRTRLKLAERCSGTVAEMVAIALPATLGTGNCTVDAVAEALGLSSRKLQRLLADEQTSFTEVMDRTRERMAIEMLTESDASVTWISGLLEYASPASFSVAFKRWTGHSPQRYRQLVQTGMYQAVE